MPEQVIFRNLMLHLKRLGILVLLCGTEALAHQVGKDKPSTLIPPVSPISAGTEKEAYLIEYQRTKYFFKADGTGERLQEARIKIQSESGVQQMGQLVWGYNAANEKMEVIFVKVLKADGSVVVAPKESVQDLAVPGLDAVPIYTDLRQTHVTVPSLRPGDRLELSIRVQVVTPYAPGKFWGEFQFTRGTVSLEERFELNVPADKAVKVVSRPGLTPSTRVIGDRKISTWSFSRPNIESDALSPDGSKASQSKNSKGQDYPDIQFTTFQNWAEMGDWYSGLERPQREVTEGIRQKTKALLQGKTADLEKVQALYDFVAKNYRFVSLSFGIGRFQPHKASEIFPNQYGDCKDKHTLLAAMLESEGFSVRSILIHSARTLDPALPSPGQFDHVFTCVMVGGKEIFMDTTTEVAPFQVLLPMLYHKEALEVLTDGRSHLFTTPTEGPFPNQQIVEATGVVDGKGNLRLHMHQTLRGDRETMLRMIFRRVPESKWKEMVTISTYSDGLFGDIDKVQVLDPSDTSQPFTLDFDYKSDSFIVPIENSASVKLPLPSIKIQIPSDSAMERIPLGNATFTERLTLTLPPTLAARPLIPIDLARDYASYRSRTKIEGNVLTLDRTLTLSTFDLPKERQADLDAFNKVLSKDQEQYLTIEGQLEPKNLDGATSAAELSEAARKASEASNYPKAIELYTRAAELDPKDKDVWNNLGLALHNMRQYDKALVAFGKAIALNPYEEYAYNNRGRTYWALKRYQEAEASFQKQLEVNPLDRYAHTNLGRMFTELKEPTKALPELEIAVTGEPKNASLRMLLGDVYLSQGADTKALEAFEEAIKLAPNPLTWNNAAYSLADHGKELDRARTWVELSLDAIHSQLLAESLNGLNTKQGMLMSSLAANWDTLGWIYYQKGDLVEARKYIESAWNLEERGEVGDHLGQIYEQQGDKAKAIHQYAMACAGQGQTPKFFDHLVKLVGSKPKAQEKVNRAGEDLSKGRTLQIPAALTARMTTADLVMALRPGGKIEDVQILHGVAAQQPMVEILKGLNHGMPLPDGPKVRVIRRAMLFADPSTHTYSLVFMTPDQLIDRGSSPKQPVP